MCSEDVLVVCIHALITKTMYIELFEIPGAIVAAAKC